MDFSASYKYVRAADVEFHVRATSGNTASSFSMLASKDGATSNSSTARCIPTGGLSVRGDDRSICLGPYTQK